MRSVELFAGAGGLALGVSQAGFSHEAVIERDQPTCTTIRKNQQREMSPVKDWPLFSCDTRDFDYASLRFRVDLVAGGPPCQPFSMGGKHGGYRDQRDMFPEAVRAVRELQPRAFIFENVKGLLRQSFFKYFGYIQLQLSYPEITRHPDEEWLDHLARLEQHHTSGSESGLCYRLVYRLLNAADYGVPQRRERVFLVGFRSDLGAEWSFPMPTHSHAALLWSQYVSNEYWDRHGVSRPSNTVDFKPLQLKGRPLFHEPWRTIRDAIADLPDPEQAETNTAPLNHEYRPGARVYKGHTGSPIDAPAKTIKAGDHGVPGGENMLVLPDGRVRYFTVRESARLQGFPDNYLFPVSWTESMRQLGNAVPVGLAYEVARSVRECLEMQEE
jgi:DNA (cytosine-5)-methyltransferase 1